ncbi:MAG: hypothetical protein HF981_20235 [Desulfobacteraceae bacterium]|nr:hypothetical protein [Desulfobacteraceae bacterium]MBC2752735.1 hypothetical protein [Desulfobacteraceae bacterium]
MHYKKYIPFSIEAIYVATGIFGPTIATLVGVKVFTTYLTPHQYGRFALAVSIALFARESIGIATYYTVVRYFSIAIKHGMYWYFSCIKRIFSTTLYSIIILCLLSFALFFVFKIEIDLFYSVSLTILLGGGLICNQAIVGILAGARKRISYSIHLNLLNWGQMIFAIIFILFGFKSAEGILIGFILSMFLIQTYSAIKIKNYYFIKMVEEGKNSEFSILYNSFFKYFWPLTLSGVFSWIQLFSDRWALNTFCEVSDVGAYFAIYQLSFSPMLMLSLFIINLIGPIIYSKIGDNTDSAIKINALKINRLISYILLIFIFIGFILIYSTYEFISAVIIGKQFLYMSWAFPWLFLSGGFYAMGQQFLISEYSSMNSKKILKIRMFSSLFSLICYALFVNFFQRDGVVWGNLLSSINYAVIAFISQEKHLSDRIRIFR